MSSFDAVYLATAGIIGAIAGAFGGHLLSSFNGRYLESYCRLRRKPIRFGQILDMQENGFNACTYLFLIGTTVALVFGTAWVLTYVPTVGLQQRMGEGEPMATLPTYTIFVFVVATAACLMGIRNWLPQLVIQDRASKVLFHTWPLWRLITNASIPLQTLEAFFAWLGHRLGDVIADEDFEEESLEDEIRTMVTAGERDGLMQKGMRDMIQGVMNLDETPVQNIMTHRSQVDALDINMPWPEMIRAVTTYERTRLPVYENSLDNIIGILLVKDLLKFLNSDESSDQIDIRPLLRNSWKVPGTRPNYELLRDFLQSRSHMAIVIDDFHEVIGVVTIEDALEEIVGEISDEMDDEEGDELVVDEASHQAEANGRVSIEKFNQRTGWDLPESDDYETLAGLLITRLGSIPREGTAVQVGGISITVRSATDRQIQLLRLVHTEAELFADPQYVPVRSIAELDAKQS